MLDEEQYEEPDFSGDDFVNDREIQKYRREREEHSKMIDDSLSTVISGLQLKKGSHVNLKGFTMFKNLVATLAESYHSTDEVSPLIISTATYHTSSRTRAGGSGEDLYLFGRMKLKSKFPPTYVCRETVKEIIQDLLTKQETDFSEHKNFSKRFYVLTNDSHRLKQLLALKSMDELTAFRDMELEMQDEFLLFRHSRKPVSREEATKFVEFTKVLSKIFA